MSINTFQHLDLMSLPPPKTMNIGEPKPYVTSEQPIIELKSAQIEQPIERPTIAGVKQSGGASSTPNIADGPEQILFDQPSSIAGLVGFGNKRSKSMGDFFYSPPNRDTMYSTGPL